MKKIIYEIDACLGLSFLDDLKNLVKRCMISVIIMLGFVQCLYALDVDAYLEAKPYDDVFDDVGSESAEENSDIGQLLGDKINGEENDENLVKQILESLGFELGDENVLIKFVNNIINFALVVIGLVAMVILIYGFYRMFFTKGEDGFGEARKLVTNAAIAIVIIGLARFITSWAFDLFYTAVGDI